MIKIALYEPRIPQNTGNIARTCAAFELELNLIKQAWAGYAKLELNAPGLKKILTYGTRNNDKENRQSR